MMNVTEGTSKTQLFRARKAMHDILKPEEGKIKINSKITSKVKTTTKILKANSTILQTKTDLDLSKSAQDCLCTAC